MNEAKFDQILIAERSVADLREFFPDLQNIVGFPEVVQLIQETEAELGGVHIASLTEEQRRVFQVNKEFVQTLLTIAYASQAYLERFKLQEGQTMSELLVHVNKRLELFMQMFPDVNRLPTRSYWIGILLKQLKHEVSLIDVDTISNEDELIKFIAGGRYITGFIQAFNALKK